MLLFVMGLVTLHVGARAEYPERNIDFIVPYSPGGGSDVFVRSLQPGLEEALQTSLVIRNIAGGGGAVGYGRAAASKPDGYTVTTPNNANFTLVGLGNVDFGYDDFEYIARVTTMPYVLAVRKHEGWKDVASFVANIDLYDKKFSVGFSGVGSSTHIAAVAIARELGVNYLLIPFGGGAGAITAAMGGHIDAVVLNPSEVLSAVQAGRLVPILSTGAHRSPVLPEVPTMLELGYELELEQWRGIAAPRGLPAEIEAIWVNAVRRAVEDPRFVRAAGNSGMEVSPLYGDELDRFVEKTAGIMVPIAASLRQ